MKQHARFVGLVWLALGVAVNLVYVGQTASHGPFSQLFYDSDVNPRTGCDFFGLYHAGYALPRGADIYAGDPDQAVVPCSYAFRYLPLGALVGVPFAHLAPAVAYALWLALLEALAVLCAWLTWRRVGGNVGGALGALWLAGSLTYLELYMGQFNLMQAALVLFALFGVDEKKQGPADAALAGTMVWKLTGWLAAPALLVRQRWRPVALATILSVLSLVLYAILTKRDLTPFVQNFLPVGPGGALYHGDLGLTMLWRAAFTPTLPTWLFYGLPALVVAFCLGLTASAKDAPLGDALALWFTAYFFIYPTIWEHHYLMLLPPLIFVYVRSRSRWLWLAAALLALPTPYYWAGAHGANWTGLWPVLYHASKLAAAGLVWVVAAQNLWRRRRAHG